MRILGISRAELFSPNRITGDRAVFQAVASELKSRGYEVICISEDELIEKGIPAGTDSIFQMARSGKAISVLGQVTIPVTNTVQAVKNCSRALQISILQGTGLIPESIISTTDAVPSRWNIYPSWIKRADSHAVESGDVKYVHDQAECAAAIKGFSERGIRECVLQAHVQGWIVKFYGVKGYGLVDCYTATEKDGKFGLERYNDSPDAASVDFSLLASAAGKAAGLLGVEVYGGDAVVGPDGTISIVDMNDWPSFRTCTVGAAQKIADLIIGKLR